ncbi:hypothetical protein SKAU_G00299920 [Synaphobranchus kaupii]|uniref:Uncharacterized protein n=1 Tax=Synaphobranchus kaupii TaxID=118154 RepID=A0A9Q1EVJ0_SYNKA|nr:hypothetical protein SKAU_G00299920 [Synaphobranchus kaupii]
MQACSGTNPPMAIQACSGALAVRHSWDFNRDSMLINRDFKHLLTQTADRIQRASLRTSHLTGRARGEAPRDCARFVFAFPRMSSHLPVCCILFIS